jgi:hypothetical protein
MLISIFPATFASNQIGFSAQWTDRSGESIDVHDLNYCFDYSYFTYIYGASLGRWETKKCVFLPIEYKDVIIGVPFKNISQVDFAYPITTVKLIDGTLLNGKRVTLGESNERFCGSTELGVVCLPISSVNKLIFNQTSKNSSSIGEPCENSHAALSSSNLTVYFETWNSNSYRFTNATIFELEDGRWINARTGINLRWGEAEIYKNLKDIKQMEFHQENRLEALVTFASENTKNLTVSESSMWLGGNLDKFGPARIKWDQVRSLEISQNIT